jgi:hypothetical protein
MIRLFSGSPGAHEKAKAEALAPAFAWFRFKLSLVQPLLFTALIAHVRAGIHNCAICMQANPSDGSVITQTVLRFRRMVTRENNGQVVLAK